MIIREIMAVLFSPFNQRSVTFRNRIGVSPMCQYSAIDGLANDWHLVHLGSRAAGGAGLVMAEATAVSPEGRITPNCLGLWNDAQIEPLKRIAAFIAQQGAVPGIQLAHAGRKASCHRPRDGGHPIVPGQPQGWQTIAPSAVGYRNTDPVPAAMKAEDITLLIEHFVLAANRAFEAGFKMIEIHAAHGYLLNQFLSPLSNFRADAYGGSFENRIRLLFEVVQAVRHVWPEELPLWVRISCTEWVEGGWSLEESIQLASILMQLGVDLIDCSSGGNSPLQKIPVGPCYQVPFAEKIKKQAGVFTAAVGLITQASECEAIISMDKADMVLLAREFLRNPYFPLQAAGALKVDIEWPQQYIRAQ
jgi:2,4-dienoyl-CoA reductase-like NADH-dependent reductase (Old Yellow Enzyme family)